MFEFIAGGDKAEKKDFVPPPSYAEVCETSNGPPKAGSSQQPVPPTQAIEPSQINVATTNAATSDSPSDGASSWDYKDLNSLYFL